MLRPSVFRAAMLVALSGGSAADEVGPLEGFWQGGIDFAQGGWRVTLSADVVGDLGRLEIRSVTGPRMADDPAQRAFPEGFAYRAAKSPMACEYLFRIEGGAVTDLSPNPNMISPLPCSPSPSIGLDRTGRGAEAALKVDFETDAMAFEIPIRASLRPMEPDEMSRTPENFDILGAGPGMSREAAEATLAQRGYARRDDRSIEYRGDGWSAEFVTFTPEAEVAAQAPSDQITLWYSTRVEDGGRGPEHVVQAWRYVSYAPGEGPDVAALRAALDEKYGARAGNPMESRHYDRTGALVPEADPAEHETVGCAMVGQPMQIEQINAASIRFPLYGGNRVKVKRNCGSRIGLRVQTDPISGRVAGLLIHAFNDDLFLQDFWWRQRQPTLKTLSERLDAAPAPAAPEL